MTPTAKLRWFRLPRDMHWEVILDAHPSALKHLDGTYRVLQQWWENEYYAINGGIEGEWRDIPVEEA